MVIVAFPPGEKYAVNYTTLDQYDYGQVLRIQGLKLPKTVEVHFSTQETGGTSITRVGVTKDGVTDVLIPDSVLENGDTTQNYSIFAFVYVTDATSGKTEYRARLEVKARPKPEVPGGGDNLDIFHEAVLEVRKSAEKAEEAQRQAEGWAHGREDLPERAKDNAKYYCGKASEDAKKTAEDRKEVERLTESNVQMQGEVEKDLEEVKKLSSQAQTSATNAALSEQKSKEAATRAETARTGAETAEDNAELAAQKTGQDKTAVEQAKKLVQQMGQEVLDNKNAVDETAQDFNLKAQQALADVNNAGQTQTERVQTAGTTAVENIKTAQNTATQAVETAKAEAIKIVADKGKEILETIPDFNAKLDTKLDKNQGAEHAGKALVVGEDGNVVPGKPQTEGVGDAADAIVETASGTLLNVKDSSEAFFEDFSMSGKTTQDGTPTPDAPVEIVNAGRLNEDTGKYEINVTINSGNLFKATEHTSGYYVDKDGKVQIAKTLGYSWTAAVNNLQKQTVTLHVTTAINTRYRLYCTDLQNTILYKHEDSGANTNDNSHTFNMPDGAKKIYVSVMEIDSAEQAEITLNLGNVTLPYEPYKEQTLTLTSDRPLTKWDRLVEQDGQIGWLYKGKQYIVTGEESLRIPVDLPSYIYGNTTSSFLAISNNDFSDKKGYLNKLPYIPEVWISQSNKEGYCLNTTNQLHVRFANTRLNIEDTASISEREKAIKAHIKQQYDAGTPYMLWYESLQEEFVPLPQEQQNAIRALTTYYPTTVVTNSEDTEMQLTYVADTKNYTDRKIEEAVSAQVQNLANLLSLMPLSTQAAMIENDTNNILDMEVPK